MTFTNMYNFNMMNGNGWGGLLQSGLNMFSGNGLSIGMGTGSWSSQMGSIWGCNMFTNCYGDVDYDKMAGFVVANALFNVGTYAIGSAIANRKEHKQDIQNSNDRITEINNQIRDLEATDAEDEIDSHFDTDITNANSKRDAAKDNYDKETTTIENLKSQLATADDKTKTTLNKQISEAKARQAKYEKEYNKYNGDESTEGSVKYCEKQKADAIKAKQKEIQAKIAALKEEKAELQEKVDTNNINKAGKKWKAVNKKTYDNYFDTDGNLKADADVSVRGFNYAMIGLKKAQTSDEKAKWVKQIKEIYSQLDEKDKTPTIIAAYNSACRYA